MTKELKGSCMGKNRSREERRCREIDLLVVQVQLAAMIEEDGIAHRAVRRAIRARVDLKVG